MKVGYKSESGAVWCAIAAAAAMYVLPRKTLFVTIPTYLIIGRWIARGARNRAHALESAQRGSTVKKQNAKSKASKLKQLEQNEQEKHDTSRNSTTLTSTSETSASALASTIVLSREMPREARPIAIVTGTNSGIGYWTAVGLAAEGYEVIITCRSKTLTQDTAKKIATEAAKQRRRHNKQYCNAPDPVLVVGEEPIECDDFASVRHFAAWCASYCQGRHLAILVNNAGGMQWELNFSKFNSKLEWHTAVNFLGPFLLTELLLPLLEQHGGRVVYVSSEAHRAPQILLEHEMLSGNKRSLREDGLSSGGINNKLLHALQELNQGAEHATGPLSVKETTSSCFARYGTSKLLNTFHAHHIARRYALAHHEHDDQSHYEEEPQPQQSQEKDKVGNASIAERNVHRVYACSLHPGCVATNFSRGLLRWEFLLNLFTKVSLLLLKTPEEGAQTSLHCALCPVEELELITRYAKNTTKTRLAEQQISRQDAAQVKESVSPYFVECAEKTESMLLAYGWDVEEVEAIVAWAKTVVGL